MSSRVGGSFQDATRPPTDALRPDFAGRKRRVVPASAHAAFDKAAHYFGIKIHKIPIDEVSRKVDLRRVKRAINSDTIMVS